MDFVSLLIVLAFGLIIGSFLNVLTLRHGVRGVGGRSGCLSCGHALSVSDLFPIVSWVWLRGRCRYCKTRISLQYPIVELGTAALFLAIFFAEPSIERMLLGFLIVAHMVAIVVYDFRHTIIPDRFVFSLIAVSFFYGLLLFPRIILDTFGLLLLDAVLTAAPLFILWAVSRGAWMGFGDVKLCLAIGLILGWPLGLLAVLGSFIIGSLVLVPLMLLGKVAHKRGFSFLPKGLTMKSEVAFGPFLVASTLLIWLTHFNDPLILFTLQ